MWSAIVVGDSLGTSGRGDCAGEEAEEREEGTFGPGESVFIVVVGEEGGKDIYASHVGNRTLKRITV